MPTSPNSLSYSKVDEVPDDILLEIFHHLLEPPGTAIQKRDTWIPVTLSHVCRNWRCLMLVSPLLWTNIFLTSFSDPTILHQYLARSRDTFLRVDIASPSKSPLIDLLAQTLSNQSHGFVSFHLYDFDAETTERVLAFFTSPAPVLRSLHIRPSLQAWVDTVFDNQMPLLSDMDIFADGDDGLMLGRKNLTRFRVRVDYVEAETVLNLLRACPTLESLDLTIAASILTMTFVDPGGYP